MKRKGFHFSVRGAIAACIVVVAGIAAWWIWPEGDGATRRDAASTKQGRIKAVTPIVVGTRTNRQHAVASNGMPVLQLELEQKNPIVRRKVEGRIVKWKNLRGEPLFTNRFEALVCEIMTATPGERFLDFDIEESFDKSFEESLSHRIVIGPDDSEEVKEMKQVVIEAKEEVRKLLSQGGSAREIITDARNELNKIADYRDQLQAAYEENLATAKDASEAIRFAKEANELLAEYGALPIDGPDSNEDIDLAYEEMIRARKNKLHVLDRKEKNEK